MKKSRDKALHRHTHSF